MSDMNHSPLGPLKGKSVKCISYPTKSVDDQFCPSFNKKIWKGTESFVERDIQPWKLLKFWKKSIIHKIYFLKSTILTLHLFFSKGSSLVYDKIDRLIKTFS